MCPPLLFLHGFLGSPTDWDRLTQHLPLECHSLSYPFNVPTFAFHLVGYSMGGRIALEWQEKWPEKILSLHLVSAHLGLKTEKEKKARLASDLALADEIERLPIDEFLRGWYDQPLFKSLVTKMDIRAMRKNQSPHQIAQMLRKHSLGLQKEYFLSQNVHLYAGELDRAYRAHYEGLPHTVIANAGHAIHLEEPEALAAHLLENLK